MELELEEELEYQLLRNWSNLLLFAYSRKDAFGGTAFAIPVDK